MRRATPGGRPRRQLQAAALLSIAGLAVVPGGGLAAPPRPVAADGVAPPAAAAVAPAEPAILAGAAGRSITPDHGPDAAPVSLAGFSLGRIAQGVRDELEARALVLETGGAPFAVVVLDLYGIDRDDVRRIRAAVAAIADAPRFAAVMVSATRNHAGPDLGGRFTAAGLSVDPAWRDRVVRAAADAVVAAWQARRPARISFATTRLARLVTDTRLPTRLDDRATLIRIESVAGRNGIAALAGFSATPESLGRASHLVSADYPGEVRRALEDAFGGVGLFLTGASGGRMSPVPPSADQPEPAPAALGRAIARGLQVAWSQREEAREPVPADLTQGTIAWRSATVTIPAAAPAGTAGAGDAASTEGATAQERITEVGLLELRSAAGPVLQVACIPGALYPELFLGGIPDPQDPGADIPGAARETPLRDLLDAPLRMVAGPCGDDLGEIIPASEWDERAPFAYGLKSAPRGEESSAGPRTADLLLKALARMMR